MFAGMFTSERAIALEQTRCLFEYDSHGTLPDREEQRRPAEPTEHTGLRCFLFQAALPCKPSVLLISSAVAGCASTLLFAKLLSPYFLPLFFLFGAALPFLYVESRIRSRALEFAQDYSTMLLAAASSVKVGLTPYEALERSTRLLAKNSLVRAEVETLLNKLVSGAARRETVREFAASIRQPDLELFRSAFLLVLDNGGRFAPTLARLAAVSNNRAVLIRSAAVSTASMRMTANILLAVAPVLVLMIAVRTEHFWDIFLHNSAANIVGSTGVIVITLCYGLLRYMSNFKP